MSMSMSMSMFSGAILRGGKMCFGESFSLCPTTLENPFF